ncbi:YcdB/YcdC domain-containing protein [Tepidibacter sp. Z1-5]|uniref:YcdB/YcdC domain-containing protein n=1 Tax=Tepidibacter sp. Z1-5 TaxID=3134138 RepID=UPI0030C264AC
MKLKKLVPIILSISILLGGCSSFSSVQKDKVMVEKTNDEENNAKISKEEAKEIAVDYLKKYYDIKEDKKELKNLIKEVKYIKDPEETRDYLYGIESNGAWRVLWDKEGNKEHSYNVLIDAKDKKLLEIQNYVGVNTKGITKRKTIIDLKQAKQKAYNFIKNNELVDDINKLKLTVIYGKGIGKFIFLYNEEEYIFVDVDMTIDKVSRINRNIAPIYICDDTHLNIKKEKAIEIALDGIEKYFNGKVDTSKLVEDISLYKEIELPNGKIRPSSWNIHWRDLRVKEEKNKDIEYSASIDANTGELREVGYINKDLNQKTSKISDEEMEQIALDFIQKSKFVSDIKDLKEPKIDRWKNYNQEGGAVGFKYKDEILWAYIDFINKKVEYIGYGLR